MLVPFVNIQTVLSLCDNPFFRLFFEPQANIFFFIFFTNVKDDEQTVKSNLYEAMDKLHTQ